MKARICAASLLWCFAGSLLPLSAEEAFTVPRSNRVIEGQLTFSDGSKTQFVTRDGTWVTVEKTKDGKRGSFYGFVGIINDKTSNPNFLIYRLIREGKKTTAVQITTPADIPLRTARRYPIAEDISLLTKKLDKWNFVSAPLADASQFSVYELMEVYGPDNGDSMCCVVCDDRTVCASSVANSCGSCNGGGGGFMAN